MYTAARNAIVFDRFLDAWNKLGAGIVTEFYSRKTRSMNGINERFSIVMAMGYSMCGNCEHGKRIGQVKLPVSLHKRLAS